MVNRIRIEDRKVGRTEVKGWSSSLVPQSFVLLIPALLIFSSAALAMTVNLQWDRNSEADLAGYKCLYRQRTMPTYTTYTTVAGQHTDCSIRGLADGQIYIFAVTAYNTAGQESSLSNRVTVNDPLATQTGNFR